MAVKAFSTLHKRVQDLVNNAPVTALTQTLQQAAKELCRDGWAWTEDLDDINIIALQSAYQLVAPTAYPESRVTTALLVRSNDVTLTFREWRSLLAQRPKHPDITTPGTPTIWSMISSQTLSLYAVPLDSTTGGLKVHAVLEPISSATGIEARIMDDYEETLIHGALHRLMAMPSKGWSDVKMADYYGRKFRNEVRECKARVKAGLVPHSISVTYPRIT